MHELSLCRSIYSVVDRAREARPVAAIHLRVGRRRQVVPDTLCYCWTMLTETTPLAGSRLVIDHVPVTVRCRACGARTTEVSALLVVCGECGGGDVTVTEGEEFMVTTMDVTQESELIHG